MNDLYLPGRSSHQYTQQVLTMLQSIVFQQSHLYQRVPKSNIFYRNNRFLSVLFYTRPAARCAVALLLSLLLLGQQMGAVLAQTTTEPPLIINGVDTTQFPRLTLTVDGADWPADRAATPLQVLINSEEQTVAEDRLMQQGIDFVLAIDPNELFTADQTGQMHYVEMTGVLLNLIDNQGILLRNQDWMAAYLLQPEGVQLVQEWTQEPNLIYNSIVQNRPAEVTGVPLVASALINGIQQFAGSPSTADRTRTLLLFSVGSDTLDVAAVVVVARELAVQIHVVELVDGEATANTDSLLSQVAQQTGGHYIALDSPEALPPLWERMIADHNQRVLTLQTTIAEPQMLEVRLQLPDGATLSNSVGPAAFADLPALTALAPTTVPATVQTVQTVQTRAEESVAVTAGALVTAGEPVAAVAQPAALPANEAGLPSQTNNTDTQNPPGAIVIPGLQVALPRGVLQFSLLVLLLLIGYFVYAEVRDRRKKHNRNQSRADRYAAAGPLFDLGDNSQPLPSTQFQLNPSGEKTGKDFSVNSPPGKSAPPPAKALPSPMRPSMRQSNFSEDDGSEEATIHPPRMEDNEATYRVQEVEQPILGYLVRATSDPNLPKELPIYGLNPAPGEVRQIHIGRHSKNNTVVINDKSISREHAVIVQREGRLYLRDNASTSGTFLNWKRLNPGEELLLRHNDLLSFGQIVYEFRLHGEDEVTIAGA